VTDMELRELDAQVAERVMGWLVEREYWQCSVNPRPQNSADWCRIPDYSTNMKVTWLMLDIFVRNHNAWCAVGRCHPLLQRKGEYYYCEIGSGDLAYESPALKMTAFAETAPLAICHAVLRLVEMQEHVQDE
jgi:hypothetical protein